MFSNMKFYAEFEFEVKFEKIFLSRLPCDFL